MKKFLSVFIPVILLAATAGVYVVNHYCMITGKTAANYNCCRQCNDECCKTDFKVIRLTIESVKQSDSKILSVFDFIPFIPSGTTFSFISAGPFAGAVYSQHDFSSVADWLRTIILRI